jgi:hypothetical protein
MAIGLGIGAVAIYLLGKLKWYHFIFIPLFAAGVAASAFLAYLVGWPLFEYLSLTKTNWIFLPMLIGSALWCFICLRLYFNPRV